MHLDSFDNSLAVQYIFPAIGHVKQLLQAFKLVPYHPILSLNTPNYGTESWVLTACNLICKKNTIVLVWHNQNGSWYICLLYNIAHDIQFLLTGRNLTKFGKFSRVLKLCSIQPFSGYEIFTNIQLPLLAYHYK